jgi:D-alanine transaminase
MSRVAYVNGQYVPHQRAHVHIEDRGYQFADGVYEVIAVRNGRFVDGEWHMERLMRSLNELSLPAPMSPAALTVVLHETVRRNHIRDGSVYLQITRGVARRDHAFPTKAPRPAVVVTAKRGSGPSPAVVETGVTVVSVPDIRWDRCDIKSVALLPNVMAKQAAKSADAYEAWQVDEKGYVTEGSSANAWIIDKDGTIVTRPAENAILNGITRRRLLELARDAGFAVEERPFTLDEAKSAREAFITSTSAFVLPVVKIDDTVIGNGRPGSRSSELRELYESFVAKIVSEGD